MRVFFVNIIHLHCRLLEVPNEKSYNDLFLNVFMNDIAIITKSAKFIIYADDATVLFPSTDTKMLAEICNRLFCSITSC